MVLLRQAFDGTTHPSEINNFSHYLTEVEKPKQRMWCHLPTGFRRGLILLTIVLATLIVALSTTLLFVSASHAAPNTNKTINFEGRLLTSAGAVVPDGNYNVQFKIYQDGTGTTAGNPNGTLKWTETHKTGNGTAVEVKNGFLSVSLGATTPFGDSIDWDADTLYLSMNVAGSAAGCSTFGSGPCAADGEMLPMKRITATPYALNAGALNGKTASDFVQLGKGVQTDVTTNSSSIYINKTGTGNLVQLQSAAVDVFTVTNSGDLTFGDNANKTISIATGAADSGGNSLSVIAGGGGSGTGSPGGDLVLQGGAAGGTNGDGGNVQIDAGTATGTGSVGSIAIGTAAASSITIGSNTVALSQTINIGANNTAGSTTDVNIGSGGNAAGGTTSIQSKNDTTLSTNGSQKVRISSKSDTLYVGNADSNGNASTANGFSIQGTSSTASGVQGGSLTVKAGSATNGDANGGNLTLSAGNGSGSGAAGLVVISTPTFQAASQQDFATSATVTQANVDGNGVIILNATDSDLTATLNDPSIRTAGRILYATAAGTSETFALSLNGGASQLSMKANATTNLLWNGTDWTVAGGTATTLQDAYDSSAKDGGAHMTLGSEGGSGLSLQNSNATPVDGTLFSVKDSGAATILSVKSSASGGNSVQIGTGTGTGGTSLLTLDKAASAPAITDPALVGSMYYDTTLGQVQCYEVSGWGACAASPDTFVTISPEYTGAVTHGTGIGTLNSDICSDGLNINDGSDTQPAICDANETHNYYDWTATAATDQTKSIYVTYTLPGNFKNFIAGSTSLAVRDADNSKINYQIYKNTKNGLVACSTAISAPITVGHAWQTAVAGTTGTDPATCGFSAGDSVVFKINLTAKNGDSAYASDLSFAFSNK